MPDNHSSQYNNTSRKTSGSGSGSSHRSASSRSGSSASASRTASGKPSSRSSSATASRTAPRSASGRTPASASRNAAVRTSGTGTPRRRKRRSKSPWKKLLPAILGLLLIIGVIVFLFTTHKEEVVEINRSTVYVASPSLSATVYREEENALYEYKDLTRGTAVTSRNVDVEINNGELFFTEIELDGEVDEKGEPIVYYISTDNLSPDPEHVVLEKTKYLRTSSTVYKNDEDAQISSFLKKGTELSICGYSGLQADGTVEMYQIDNPGSEGYIYAKYIVDTQEEADQPYTQIADNHSGRVYPYGLELYGGDMDNFDWYPVDKPEMSSGPLLSEARAMYISTWLATPSAIQDYISLALSSGANAMVIDIKDGVLAYESEVARELSPTSYETSIMTVDQYKEAIQMVKGAGLYAIGRIVCFNDDIYASDHPEVCIISDVEDFLWPSAYNRDVWYYNVALAQEAVQLFGFDEIQFDYVRFPESAWYMSDSDNTDFLNTYDEDKGEAIQNFCFYAADQIHEAGAYLSIDVFGECSGPYITAYGQYWPAISNVVDAISGMPYTDHFGSEVDTWSHPYTTVYEWASSAAKRQTEIKTPAVARTWITGYDVPNWDPTVIYGAQEMIDQAQALLDSGLTGGFIPWNAVSDLDKYNEYAAVWADQY